MKEDVYKKLLDPKFDASIMEWDTFVGLASDVLETKEVHQKVLGKIASSLGAKYGDKKINQFAEAITGMTGYKISPTTIRSYRWVYEKLKEAIESDAIPEDWSYTTWRHVASTENPLEWIDRCKTEGLSGGQLVREIKLSKGVNTKEKVCPNCGQEL